MKIAIIGGGWVGCHLAYKLREKHEVTIFEKNENLFEETSYFNQNRLHLGFHYARNSKTRDLCKETFSKFIDDYGFITEKVNNNIYCVPIDKSIIDYRTYIQIFKEFKFDIFNSEYMNIEGCILTDERHIRFDLIHDFFNEKLKDILIIEKIDNKKIKNLSKKYDLVINSTNNNIKSNKDKNSFFELTISLIYQKNKNINFGALTLVDGELFSIYPYKDDLYTLTDVENTPIKKFKSIHSLDKFKNEISDDLISNKIRLMESKVLNYYPNFNNDFTYSGYFLSKKSKIVSESDSRYPVITKNKNIINCFTGKIQGIYIIEKYINDEINNR